MSKIVWDETGKKLYETGVKNGVLYIQNNGVYPLGIAWNGLTGITESPSGAEATPLYADDIKYLNLMSAEEFGATVEAYTYPDEFALCDGSAEIAVGVSIGQQNRKSFGLAYRTTLGNDTDGGDHGYKLHLIYGALAAPSEKGYQTINESPEAITFSWELTTTPVEVSGKKPTASLVINSTKVDKSKLETLEAILYGSDGVDPRLPLPDEVASLFTGSQPAALELSTSVPADSKSSVVTSSDITLTFNNKITKESILITTADGSIVPGTKTWDATGKILTFTPTSSMAAATVHLINVIGVIDIYGGLLAPVVRKFTTA